VVQQKLNETMKVLQLNGDDLETIKTRVKAIQGLIEKLEERNRPLPRLRRDGDSNWPDQHG
jgi:ppGpp synthetase/RelA/SpoT-type nucleotidyltranferase